MCRPRRGAGEDLLPPCVDALCAGREWALAAGLVISEVPTHERRRAAGYSKISLSNPGIWLAYGWQLLNGLCRRRTPVLPRT